MVGLTYNTFTTSLANMIVVPVNDPNFVIALPNIIDDAEQRLYRELDLLSTVSGDNTAVTVAGINRFTLPISVGGSGPFVVLDDVNIITPVGATPDTGTRNPLLPVSRDVLFNLYPNSAVRGVPSLFCRSNENVVLLGPCPDAGYIIETVGTIRPTPLSASNQTTFLSTYLPDVFLAAALVMSAGYQLNFSAAGDNPQAGVTWESHVKTLLTAAKIEEFRKKFGSEGWTSKEPDPIATPPRT